MYLAANTCPQHPYLALGISVNGAGSGATGRVVVNRSSDIPWLKTRDNRNLTLSKTILTYIVASRQGI